MKKKSWYHINNILLPNLTNCINVSTSGCTKKENSLFSNFNYENCAYFFIVKVCCSNEK